MNNINKKDILNLSDAEIKKQVKDFMNENVDLEYIKNTAIEAIETDNYYLIDDTFQTTIDIYISDQAGSYITKEAIEMFNFTVNEKKYKKELSQYVYISENIFNYASEYINNYIDFENGTFQFIIDGDFKLDFFIDAYDCKKLTSDYSFLRDCLENKFYDMKNKKLYKKYFKNENTIKELINSYKPILKNEYWDKEELKKELKKVIKDILQDYIPKKYKDKKINSIDVDMATSLTEYASLFKLNNNNYKCILSSYDYDSNTIFYKTILFTDKKDMLQFINESLEYISENYKKQINDYLNNYYSYDSIIKNLIALKRQDQALFFNVILSVINDIYCYDASLIDGRIRFKKASIPLEILENEL